MSLTLRQHQLQSPKVKAAMMVTWQQKLRPDLLPRVMLGMTMPQLPLQVGLKLWGKLRQMASHKLMLRPRLRRKLKWELPWKLFELLGQLMWWHCANVERHLGQQLQPSA